VVDTEPPPGLKGAIFVTKQDLSILGPIGVCTRARMGYAEVYVNFTFMGLQIGLVLLRNFIISKRICDSAFLVLIDL
jgi:hypothetical protein